MSLREIFADAAEITAPAARAAFLEDACGENRALRERVECLLAADTRAGNFLRDRAEFPTEQPGDLIGRYRLIERLGQGGSGVVYLAEQESPVRRRVALKVIKLGMDTQSVIARFEAERQALARMEHPNIAKVFDAGATETGRPFFVMELVTGEKLSDYCERRQLSPRQRVELFIPICQAVQHAHQKGIIHRDLKPSNILVSEHEGVAVPKLIDFGIAKATGQFGDAPMDLTSTHQFVGTPAYMSPEQLGLGGRDVDTRSDIYSLGVILYELLAGQPPFSPRALTVAGLDEMRRIIREVDPPRPSTTLIRNLPPARSPALRQLSRDRLAAVRGDLDWIVMKCLEKDRARRYETANGLAADLRRHLEDEPVVARPPSGLYRLQKVTRRHRLAFSVTLVGVVVLLLATIVSLQSAWRAQRAEQEQTRLRERAEAAARENQQLLIRRYVSEGNRLAEAGRPLIALPWLVEALEFEAGDPDRETDERLRIAQALGRAPDLKLHLSQGNWVRCVAFSPDGKLLATGGDDGTVRISPVAEGGLTFTNLSLPGSVSTVKFSPDGTRLVAVDRHGRAQLWDAITGAALTSVIQAADYQEVNLRNLATRLFPATEFHPAQDQLLLAWGSESAQLRNATTGKLIRNFTPGGSVWHATFSPDGRYVATSSEDGGAQVWETATGQPAGDALPHTGMVAWSQFSPDGEQLLTVRARRFIQIWDWRKGQRTGPEIPVSSVLFHASLSPNGRQILAASWWGKARLFDAATGHLQAEFNHDGGLVYAAFSPDGEHFATACHDGNAWLWNTSDAHQPVAILPAGNETDQVVFSADGRQLAVASRGGTARVWELFPPQPGLRHLPSRDVTWVEFDATAEHALVAGGGAEGEVRIYVTATGGVRSSAKFPANRIRGARFSPDGTRVLVFGSDTAAQVLAAETGQPVLPPLSHAASPVDALWSADGKWIATAAGPGGAHLWSAHDGRHLGTIPHSNHVLAIAFSPEGKHLATAHEDRTVRVWGTNPLRLVAGPWPAIGALRHVHFSPSGRQVAFSCYSSGGEGLVHIYDMATGKVAAPPLTHRDDLLGFEYSRDGRRIATACEDHTARVWDAQTGAPISPWLPHAYETQQVHFSPDGERLATVAGRGRVRVWVADTGEPLTATWNYRREGGTYRLHFSHDGRQLLISTGDHVARLLELQPATASLAELRLRAAVLSCRQWDPAAGLVPLPHARLDEAWRELRTLRSAR